MLTTACGFVVGFGFGSGFDSVPGWLVVMHTYLYYFPLSRSYSQSVSEARIANFAQYLRGRFGDGWSADVVESGRDLRDRTFETASSAAATDDEAAPQDARDDVIPSHKKQHIIGKLQVQIYWDQTCDSGKNACSYLWQKNGVQI